MTFGAATQVDVRHGYQNREVRMDMGKFYVHCLQPQKPDAVIGGAQGH